MNLEFLKEMIDTPSLSGNEFELQKKIIKHMEPLCDKVITDHVGNVISVINPDSKVKILLDAHIDEIGLVISNIKADGRCKMQSVGSIRPALYLGMQVQVVTKNGIIDGVIAQYRPIQADKVETAELELDLGTFSKEESEKLVSIGDYVLSKASMVKLQNNNYAARAMDDKIGVYSILQALLMAKELGATQGVYASSTVGEETTANGAVAVANLVEPTMAIVVDVMTDTSSLPSLSNRDLVYLGKGPAITLGTIMNKKLKDLIEKVAKENNIPIQYTNSGDRTWTNADKIHFVDKGIPTMLLNIPLRYMHSSAEVANMDDVNNLSKLMALVIKEIDEDFNFNPYE